ncbi:MAG: hypothetical protein R3E32_03770 [Chitinophagales bacterium]
MHQTKLIDLLKSFSDKEIRQFEDFVASPFFNKNQDLLKLLRHLKKYYPEFTHNQVDKSIIFKKLFGKAVYNDQKMRTRGSQLYRLGIQFLEQLGMSNSYMSGELFGLEELINRKQDRLISYHFKQIQKKFENPNAKNELYFLHLSTFYEWQKNYYLEALSGAEFKHFKEKEEQAYSQTLTSYYLLKLLRQYALWLNLNNIYQLDMDLQFYEEVIELLMPLLNHEEPIILMTYTLAQMLRTREEKHYHTLKKLVTQFEEQLTKNQLEDFYINLENYCLKEGRRTGDVRFTEELFQLYQFELERKIPIQNGEIPRTWFSNFATIGTHLKHTDVAEQFIQQYQKYLPETVRTNTANFCMSYIRFYQSRFQEALQYLMWVNYDGFYDKIDYRNMLVCIYYELDETEALYAQIDAYKHFLNNNKHIMAEDRLLIFSNFIRFVSRLLKLKESVGDYKDPHLLEDLKNCKQITFGNWLREKANRLQENKKQSAFRE